MAKLLEFNGKQIGDIEQEKKQERSSKKNDVAIIGMSGIVGNSKDMNEFWINLLNGTSFIDNLNDERKKSNNNYIEYSKKYNILKDDATCFPGAYMSDIYSFDNDLFSISPREASLMDPNQRKFIEVAYHTIEDAGYGGDKLKGTNTGVFLGYSDDFFENYKHNILLNDPSSYGLSLVGNIRSIISGRISYFLDLKGPSITFDTACSSSLIAIKEACIHILNNECEMAIAGGVKIIQSPIKDDDWEIKVQSPDNIARTFDDSASGTGIGEGAVAFLLKPLDKALKDKDNIYAVIKGWANNQDGKSIGITAPSPKAQEDLMTNLLKNTGVNPEEITFVEAHGTGTKLGDPIEVTALTNAFRKYTNRKQFCAISSVKTNIGHLDCAAGAVGVAKAVLCLKNKILPPHLHFKKINREIDLINSPFYIPAELTNIDKNQKLNKAVISSFGLSGTNCQILIEEAPHIESKKEDSSTKVISISARNEKSFNRYIKNHMDFIKENKFINLDDYCFTCNTGRAHFEYRCLIIFSNRDELLRKLEYVNSHKDSNKKDGVYIGKFKIIDNSVIKMDSKEISLKEKSQLDLKAKKVLTNDKNLNSICDLYIKGAFIDWEDYYSTYDYCRISAPVYPYNEVFYSALQYADSFDIKLLVESYDLEIYSLKIFSNQWVVNEHKVDGYKVLPGTAYIEIISNLFKRYYNKKVEIKELFFEKTLSFEEEEDKVLQIRFNKNSNEIVVCSKSNGIWIEHANCQIEDMKSDNGSSINIDSFIKNADKVIDVSDEDYREGFVSTGPRWNNIRKIYYNKNYILAYIELKESFAEDFKNFEIHPAMLDCAANLGKEQYIEGNFLPFRYEDIKIYSKLTRQLYSYIELKNDLDQSDEILTFDVKLVDIKGNLLMDINHYSIKKVNKEVIEKSKIEYFNLQLRAKPLENKKLFYTDNVLVIKNDNEISREVEKALLENNVKYTLVNTNISINDLSNILTTKSIRRVIHLGAFSAQSDIKNIDEFEQVQEDSVINLFKLSKAIFKSHINDKLSIVILGNKKLYPDSTTAYGIGKVMNKEFYNVSCKTIDIDEFTNIKHVLYEMDKEAEENIVYFRNNVRYIEELRNISIDNKDKFKINLKGDGVYIIPGGTGSIGLEVCKYLIAKGAKNIVLISRNGVIKEADQISYNLVKEISKEYNSKLAIYKCNLSHYEDMKEIINQIKKKYKKINGVINCAGNAGDGLIINKSLETFHNVLKAKVHGTWILDQLLQDQNLDFFIIMSSTTALTAEIGQSDYTAANFYLNCFAERRRAEGKNYIAIGWPAWRDVGMAVRYGVDTSKALFKAIKNVDAIRALDEIISFNVSTVIPGELNIGLANSLKKKLNLNLSDEINKRLPRNYKEPKKNTNQKDVIIRGKYQEEIDEIENEIAKIWANVLQLEEIDVNDNFNTLGGDSILAIRLLRELNSKFDNMVDMSDIYTYSSVDKMAKNIRRQKEPIKTDFNEEEDLIDNILDKLEQGTVKVDEIKNLLEKQG
ncbi:type I polyketide synthase [Lachnotalea glycerini]|uniref:SDR family NAD(P)-dependent oxidoreductase n=1 Tax=Lachnotalea glycerini TaxID=1763509 RepID=A0A371JK16_9FIRM|nr:type I polyketide synthase [Lachnotalea glycerini]RDY33069.1 SDR family NAD(P)-dependent oxidoreductase [Lachnotalea glycerini]